MFISFTGAQSTGKSTLLQECKKLDLKVKYVDEVTRFIKRKYKVPINEHAGDTTQILIINQHVINSLMKKNVIMDRCIIDGLVYTYWLYEKGKVSKWVLDYAKNVYDMLISKIDVIFYCQPDFDLVDDGERSTDVIFRDEIIMLMDIVTSTCKPEQLVKLSGTVEQRMETIINTLNKHGITTTRQ